MFPVIEISAMTIDSTALGKLIACQQPQWACCKTHHPKV